MTNDDIIEVVNNISYKEDVKIFARHSNTIDGIEVLISRLTKDATQRKLGLDHVVIRSVIFNHLNTRTEKDILEHIYHTLRNFEMHELEEWYKYKNKWVKNPHPELKEKVYDCYNETI
jgi:hypothetical protein